MITPQLEKDLSYTFEKLDASERSKLAKSTILITGSAGFLGFYFVHFLYRFCDELSLKKIICLDNFMLGEPDWQKEIAKDERFIIKKFNIISDRIEDIPEAKEADYIIHMASVASPMFYRKYPIQTIDANVWGLRRLFEFYKDKKIKGFLFFSSSELYGDPVPEAVPTSEDYNGNVCATGPRACYDESKRFGETMCRLFAQEYDMPIGVVRPFNNYGPGMKVNDARVPADFAKNIMEGNDITILPIMSSPKSFIFRTSTIKISSKYRRNGAEQSLYLVLNS